jgi:flagellar motor switch protein FliN
MNGRDMLSQEEIDALLRQNNFDINDDEEVQLNIRDYLSEIEQDALGEIGNICYGSSATALSTLLGQKTDITTPQVGIVQKTKLAQEFPRPHVAVHVQYTEGFRGINLFVIRTDDAKIIADLMMGGTGRDIAQMELSELHVSAVQEAMNQMMGSAATSMSTLFNRRVDISPPGIDLMDLSSERSPRDLLGDEDVLIKISFRLRIGDLIDSNLMQLVPVSFAKEMVHGLLQGAEQPVEEPALPSREEVEKAGAQPLPMPQSAYQEPVPPQQSPFGQVTYAPFPQQPYGQPMYPGAQPYQQQMYPPQYQQPSQAFGGFPSPPASPPPNVQAAQFSPFPVTGPAPQMDERNLGLLLDIPLQVTVELGRTKRQIREILELSAGSIIELDKLAGEPVDIFVNNKLIAKGEVVVIEENFGVRVTDIISQWDRVQKLQ